MSSPHMLYLAAPGERSPAGRSPGVAPELDVQGKLIEAGDASQVEKDWWQYTPQAEGRVSASTWDIPGNRVRMELE